MNISPKQLSELIQLAVKKALKEQLPVLVEAEMRKFKRELLSEKSPITNKRDLNVSAPTQKIKASPRPTPQSFVNNIPAKKQAKYADDPFLNEILSNTQPLREQSFMNMFADGDSSGFDSSKNSIVNVPTTETGQPIQHIPSHVLNAMNKDYSGMFSEQTSKSGYLSKQNPSVADKSSQVRSMLKNMVVGEPHSSATDDEEDFSWLDNV